MKVVSLAVSLSLCLSLSLFVAMWNVAGLHGMKYMCKAMKSSADSVVASTCTRVGEV